MKGFVFIVLILSSCTNIATAQTKADSLFNEAERLFNSLEPTDATDKEALKNYFEVIKLLQRTSSSVQDSLEAVCYERVGTIYQDRGKFLEALTHYHKGVSIKERLHGTINPFIFKEITLIGTIHYYEENYDSAAYYYLLAEKIAEKHSLEKGRDRLYNAMGILYYQFGNYTQAINYYEKALLVTDEKEADSEKTIAYFTNNIADAQRNLGNYLQAISLYKSILKKEIASAILYHHLGSAYVLVNQYDSAIIFLRKAIDTQDHFIKKFVFLS